MNTITHNIFVTIKPSKKLAKVNRRTMVLAVAGIGFAVWAEINRRSKSNCSPEKLQIWSMVKESKQCDVRLPYDFDAQR